MAKTRKMPPKGIVINRMFTGNYLDNNLGHEIINLFRADNGNCYVYLNASGNIAPDHRGVDTMLMVRNAGHKTVEVLAKASGLSLADGAICTLHNDEKKNVLTREKQYQYISNEPITYLGVPLTQIFNEDEQQDVFVTWKAEEVKFVKTNKRVFIHYDKDKLLSTNDNSLTVLIASGFPNQSLRNYIMEDNDDYLVLKKEIVDNIEIWENRDPEKIESSACTESIPVSVFDVLGITYEEKCYTNLLGFCMTLPSLKDLFVRFFKNLSISISANFSVNMEFNIPSKDNKNNSGGRIDLLISDDENLVVIENKILSGINTVARDNGKRTQLNRYFEYVTARAERENKKSSFILLMPDYNIPELSDKMAANYKIVTYSELYKFIISKTSKETQDCKYIKLLQDAIYLHTFKNLNEVVEKEMQEKFINRIRENQKK